MCCIDPLSSPPIPLKNPEVGTLLEPLILMTPGWTVELFDLMLDGDPSPIVLCGAWNQVHRGQRGPERQSPKVLRDSGQQELIASTRSTSKPEAVNSQDPFHMGEQHFNLLSGLARLKVSGGVPKCTRHFACCFIEAASDFSK